MNADLVKIVEIFLVPTSILVGALGVATTEGLKTGVSLLGLLACILWAVCGFSTTIAKPKVSEWILRLLPVIFAIFWVISACIHGQPYLPSLTSSR